MESTRETPWPAVEYESLPWVVDYDAMEFVSKTARRKISATYRAAIPASIAQARFSVPSSLMEHISELSASMARFDAEQSARGFDLPALLLRSESSASSQIENLTSSARNIALAELYPQAPKNARIIVGNIAAMRKALSLPDDFSIDSIRQIHHALFEKSGGNLRDEQVWVGGAPYSPHGAIFVPPAPNRVPACLADLAVFVDRSDMSAVAKAAIAHAQFETIHPFSDGNGRCGRTLLHKALRRDGALARATLPVSAGLLHNIDAYMASIEAYQQGDPSVVVEQLCDALDIAVAVGRHVAEDIAEIIEAWRDAITERKGASIHNLPALIVKQPVVSSSYIAEHLSITRRAATTLIAKACDYGMLRPMGNRLRGEFFQSDAIIAVLQDASDIRSIRRMLGTAAS